MLILGVRYRNVYEEPDWGNPRSVSTFNVNVDLKVKIVIRHKMKV